MDQDYRSLRRFVEHDDQPAFAKLVDKHIRLVYGICLRELGRLWHRAKAIWLLLLALGFAAKSVDSI